jgi:methylase of polypeptide subunit release factors
MTKAAVNPAARVEFGDWQTPPQLARDVLEVVHRRLRRPRSIVEPTCGRGAFLVAAKAVFPGAVALGFDISEAHVESARESLAGRAAIEVADFFEVQWEQVFERLADPILIIGNPPWVTNSKLGTLDAGNLPPKANFKRQSGFDAMTGKSNFDISEWMLIRLLELVRDRRFTIAMLCKASVARRLMQHVAGSEWGIGGEVRAIDARTHFSAAVDAVLLHMWKDKPSPVRWSVYSSLSDSAPTRTMGVIDGRVVGDVDAHEKLRSLAGESEIEWRSGVKHDCAKVMELVAAENGWTNGLGETVELERSHVYPLLKGSDIANGRVAPRRHVIVTQRVLGEDTGTLRTSAPQLWKYLHDHSEPLNSRKSSIYAKQPAFSMFGVGDYSFAPYKVAICGLYKRFSFAVIRPHEGQPVMVDDTVYFLPCADEEQAQALALALGSPTAQEFFEARVFWDAKRPINKALLQSLSLEALLRAMAP